MSVQCSVYIATSVDGYIARKDGSIDWLPPIDESEGGEDYGYAAFMSSIDYVVMGRNTYETALKLGGAWPYEKPVIVLSTQDISVPGGLADKVDVKNLAPGDIAHALEKRGARRLYVDGGNTIQRFLRAGLITDITITTVPVILGDGIPLFGPMESDLRLVLKSTASFPSGLVMNTYRVAPRG